jgi:hypothetical protein
MRTHLRTIALIAATVAVLGALLVLFIRVRSAPEIVIPDDALSVARARYESIQTGRAPAAFASERGAGARPPRRPPASEPASEPGAEPFDGEPIARRSISTVRPAAGSGESPVYSPPTGEQERVRAAYDHGDFEGALELAEQFLRQYPKDPYVKRVAVVAACAMGEEAVARKHYQEMAASDQPIVAKRCSRYGIQL